MTDLLAGAWRTLWTWSRTRASERATLRYRRKLTAVISWIVACALAAIIVLIVGEPLWLILIALGLVVPYFMLASGLWQWSNIPQGFRAWLHR